VREIEEVVIGIVEAVIGNETGRESTSDGLVHGKESGRGIKFQAGTFSTVLRVYMP